MTHVFGVFSQAFIIAGIYMLGKKRRAGFLVISTGSAVAATLQWNATLYPIAVGSGIVIASNLLSWKKWHQDAK